MCSEFEKEVTREAAIQKREERKQIQTVEVPPTQAPGIV
jgi:hypothetical protein